MTILCNDKILWYLQPKGKVFLQTNSNESSLIHRMMIYKNIHMCYFLFKNHMTREKCHMTNNTCGWSFQFSCSWLEEIWFGGKLSHLKILQLSMFVKGILMEIVVSWESQLWLGFFMVVFSMLFWLFFLEWGYGEEVWSLNNL